MGFSGLAGLPPAARMMALTAAIMAAFAAPAGLEEFVRTDAASSDLAGLLLTLAAAVLFGFSRAAKSASGAAESLLSTIRHRNPVAARIIEMKVGQISVALLIAGSLLFVAVRSNLKVCHTFTRVDRGLSVDDCRIWWVGVRHALCGRQRLPRSPSKPPQPLASAASSQLAKGCRERLRGGHVAETLPRRGVHSIGQGA